MGVARLDAPSFAIDLINTWGPYLAEPELLQDVDGLAELLQMHGVTAPANANALRAALELRQRLVRVVDGEQGTLAERLNGLIRIAGSSPVVREAEGRWRLQLEARDARNARAVMTARAANDLLELLDAVGPERIRRCAAMPCRELFVDTSRSGSRAYCSRRCANRLNAERHRTRRRADATRRQRGALGVRP